LLFIFLKTLNFKQKKLILPRLKGVLNSKNGMTAEIIPIEPEQVMLLRENRIKDEVHVIRKFRKIIF